MCGLVQRRHSRYIMISPSSSPNFTRVLSNCPQTIEITKLSPRSSHLSTGSHPIVLLYRLDFLAIQQDLEWVPAQNRTHTLRALPVVIRWIDSPVFRFCFAGFEQRELIHNRWPVSRVRDDRRWRCGRRLYWRKTWMRRWWRFKPNPVYSLIVDRIQWRGRDRCCAGQRWWVWGWWRWSCRDLERAKIEESKVQSRSCSELVPHLIPNEVR